MWETSLPQVVMIDTTVSRSFGFFLGETFGRLRRNNRDDYHDALIRIVLSFFFVVSSQHLDTAFKGDPLGLSAFTSIAFGYHLGSQSVFLHLVCRPSDVRFRQAAALFLDTSTTLFIPLLWPVFGLVLVPWVLWSSRLFWIKARAEQDAGDKTPVLGSSVAQEQIITASHDLKAPLGGIISTVEVLQATEISDEQRQLLRLLKASCRVLRTCADQVLDGDRLLNASLTIDRTNDDLRSRLKDITDIGHALSLEKGLNFVSHIAPEVPETWFGDGAKLDQILINLIANAVKFTDHGSVSLNVGLKKTGTRGRRHQSILRFTVRDSGIGLSHRSQNTVFERYVQAKEHHSQRRTGHGLGLAICRKTIEIMGGELTVDSMLGQGTEFQIDLPLMKKPMGIEDDGTPSKKHFVLKPGARAKAQKILVVDDDPFTRRVYGFIAKQLAAQIDFATTGKDGLRKIKTKHYDVLLLDQNLPDSNGLEIASQIQSIDQSIYIILVTGDIAVTSPSIWKSVGIRAMFEKPIDRLSLQNELTRLLNASH